MEKRENKSKLDVTQAAEDWSGRGVYCIPLQSGQKRPKNAEWQHLRLVSDDFGKAFKPGDNLGGLWGKPSNWAVDLDLDLPTAPLVAQHILKEFPTLVYGRRQKRDSHYVFRCKNIETHKWVISGPDEIGTVVEIRSTGAQSVLPPSRHPEGDRYIIEEDEDLLTIKKTKLESLANEIAIASTMLHYYPKRGQHGRHDYVHACTGAMCHAKWKEEKIRRVMAAVLSEVVGEDEEIKDRLGSVVNTIQQFKAGNQIKGLTTLTDFMTKRTVMALRQWFKPGTAETLLEAPPERTWIEAPKKKNLRFNLDWLNVPGLVGDVIRWSHKRAYIQQPIFDLAAGLMCTAYASGNSYVVQGWDTPISPYLMVTAPTGGGKDSVLSAITDFCAGVGLYLPFRGFQSYYALLDTLSENSNVCMLWDEAARNLAAAKNINGPDFQTITHIISLYGAGNKIIAATPGRKNPIPALKNPFLTLLATAQPDMLMDSLTSTAEETGFVNRFVLFDTGNEMPPLNMRRTRVFPSEIKKQAQALMRHEARGPLGFTEIGWEHNHTYVMYQEFEERARSRTIKKEYTWSRANQNALILAGIAAVGVNPHRPVITDEIAEWSMAIVRWSCDCWEEKLRVVGGGSIVEQQSKNVERMIRNPTAYLHLTKSAKQVKQHALLKAGFMPKSVLQRGTRSIQPYRLDEILNTLHEAELIGSVLRNDQTCYFAKE